MITLSHTPVVSLIMINTQLLQTWQVELSARGCSGRTMEEWPAIVARCSALTGQPIDQLDRDSILRFLAQPTLGASSKATYAVALRSWHKWLCLTGRRPDNPMSTIPTIRHPKGRPNPLTTDEVGRALATPMWPTTQVKVLVAAYQGLRVHEIAKVRGEEINPWGGTLGVRGKGGRLDTLPLHPKVAVAATRMPREGWWFPSPSGGHVSGASVSDALAGVLARAGIRGRTPHSFRHWYATELIRAGAPLLVVKELMRHESVATTQRYVQVADDAPARALHLLPDVG